MSRKRSGSIRRFRRRSARIRTATFSTGFSEFVTARNRTLPGHPSCPSSIRSRVDARKSAPTIRPQSFMRRRSPRDVWADPDAEIDLSAIKNLVAVHRLREVSCLYGFTRFEAAPTGADGDIEDIQLSVRGAPISRDADWLPAIEQFGEGIFIHFDEAAIGEWLREGAHGASQSKASGWLWTLAETVCGEGACLPGNPICPSSQYLSRTDGRNRVGLRLSGQFVEGASLRAIRAREAAAISTAAASSSTPRARARRGHSGVSSQPLPDLRISSRAPWIACGFAQTIRFAPIMNRTTGAVIERPTARRAMDAS